MAANESTAKAFPSAIRAAALVVSLLLTGCDYVLHPYEVVGSSMSPLLKQGDKVFVDQSPQARANLHDGDVIVIRREGEIVLKRILAVPGETISGANRDVFRNGKRLEEPYLAPPEAAILGAPTGFDPRTVAPGELFVMGDNRDISFDSRSSDYAPVKFSDVVGQYRWTYWHAPSIPNK